MLELRSYGKSMYGGWYVNWFKGGEYGGEHFRTLSELKNWVAEHDLTLPKYKRYDNL